MKKERKKGKKNRQNRVIIGERRIACEIFLQPINVNHRGREEFVSEYECGRESRVGRVYRDKNYYRHYTRYARPNECNKRCCKIAIY